MSLDAYRPRDSSGGGTSGSGVAQSNHDMAKIFVGGLSWQTTEEPLRYHFEQYGEVVSVEVMKDRNTGDPRGFAFVVFKDDATVELVMQNLPHEINHKIVDVKRAQARGSAPPSIHGKMDRGEQNSSSGGGGNGGGGGGGQSEMSPEELQNKIFVGGLPLHVNNESLKEFFSQFGTVVDAIVMMDTMQGRSRGFGFVTFQGSGGAQSGGAQLALKSQPIYIDNKYVEIKLATPKGEQAGKKTFHNTGLRNAAAAAAASSQAKGEFAGLAASFGRQGWKAGYGSYAFGSGGWAVTGWEDLQKAPEKSGFSFDLTRAAINTGSKNIDGGSRKRDRSFDPRESKRSRH